MWEAKAILELLQFNQLVNIIDGSGLCCEVLIRVVPVHHGTCAYPPEFAG